MCSLDFTKRHFFTGPPTQELVDRMTALYKQGRTDVRSMIPVLNGLDKVCKDLLLASFRSQGEAGVSILFYAFRICNFLSDGGIKNIGQ